MIYNTSSQLKGPFRFTVARLLSSSFFVYLTFSLLRVYQGPSSARPPPGFTPDGTIPSRGLDEYGPYGGLFSENSAKK
jgi:hypothetical protein